MKLTINGKEKEVGAKTLTVHELLEQLNIRKDITIIEVNKKIVQKNAYGTTALQTHDTLEIITLVGGG